MKAGDLYYFSGSKTFGVIVRVFEEDNEIFFDVRVPSGMKISKLKKLSIITQKNDIWSTHHDDV